MKEKVFRIGAVVLFGIIIFATVFTAVVKNGGNYTQTMAELEGEPLIKTGKIYYNKLTRKQQYIYDTVEKAAEELEMLTEKMPLTAEMAEAPSTAQGTVLFTVNGTAQPVPVELYRAEEGLYSYFAAGEDGE